MKVRITKCSNKNYWYADKIDEVFEVEQRERYYMVKDTVNCINFNDCDVIEYEPVLIAEQPNEKLFTAAVAAMQGVMANENTVEFADFYKINKQQAAAIISWDYAEALINEGKKRGHLK